MRQSARERVNRHDPPARERVGGAALGQDLVLGVRELAFVSIDPDLAAQQQNLPGPDSVGQERLVEPDGRSVPAVTFQVRLEDGHPAAHPAELGRSHHGGGGLLGPGDEVRQRR